MVVVGGLTVLYAPDELEHHVELPGNVLACTRRLILFAIAADKGRDPGGAVHLHLLDDVEGSVEVRQRVPERPGLLEIGYPGILDDRGEEGHFFGLETHDQGPR